MGYAAGKTVIGLDIEPGYVAAVESRPGRIAIERAAVAPLAAGVVREGEVEDIDALAGVLRKLFSENKLGRRVRLGVANQRIVMRTLHLPPMTDQKELASAVRFQAQENIPMPLEQAVLEHHSLGIVETAEGPRTRVVVVAARRDMIDKLLEAARRGGLRPAGIDLSAFAMIRALHRAGDTEAALYISVGGITNLAVAVGTTCVFTRVVAHGAESMAADLAGRRGLTLEHAHGWLRHVGLLTPIDDVDGDPEIVLEARHVLTDAVGRIADEVRNSLDYYTMQEAASPVQRAVLTGPAVAIPGFSDQLATELAIPLEAGIIAESRAGAGGADAGSLAVAAGLTAEEVPA
ncbi:MAG TPA: type IV pilus assembly protein PilM [Solirubrobacteraceae bacterium]|jgi:type IV pilus assembly protein PilM|nr:type IV pilus assembly protein PilM [Solirubrobacteraceae bacterium]